MMAVAAAALPACHSGKSSSAATDPAPTASRPATYRIVYHVTQPGDAKSERWEELTVRRPFEARDAVFSARPTPDATPVSGTLATLDHLYIIQSQGLQELSGRQPAAPTGDQDLAAVLAEAERRKLVGPAGTRRTVVGRPCRDHPFLEPPAGVIKPLTGKDRDLMCIDGDGLLLREEWTIGGKVALLREAESVDLVPTGLDRVLSPAGAAPTPVPTAVPAVGQPLEAAKVIPDPPVPAGFTATTKVGFAMPGPQQQPGIPPPVLYTSTIWAFGRGGDSITVEAGTSGGSGPPPWLDTDPTRPVDLPIGKATSAVRNDGFEVRVDLGNGKWLRVRGTVPLADVVAYARTLPHPA